ncbi:MAG: hypothetical protein FJZ01_23525 [Candidatus Sericytochromatia bacterium]|nr:hypothetical protein [Candidatus Tanganyikabacteria bacterium]
MFGTARSIGARAPKPAAQSGTQRRTQQPQRPAKAPRPAPGRPAGRGDRTPFPSVLGLGSDVGGSARPARQGAGQFLPDAKRHVDDAAITLGGPKRVKGVVKGIGEGARSFRAKDASAGPDQLLSRGAKVQGSALSFLGGAGAGLQAVSGVRNLMRGNVRDGAKDITAGALGGLAAASGLPAPAAGAKARGLFAAGEAARNATGRGLAAATTAARKTGVPGLKALSVAKSFGTKVPVAAPLAGAANALTGGADLVGGIKHGKAEKAAVGGANMVGGGLLVASAFAGPAAPLLAGAGGVILLGTTAWKYRKEIGKGLRWAGKRLAKGAKVAAAPYVAGAKVAAEGAKVVAGGAKAAAGGVKDAAGKAKDFVGGLF